MAMKRKIASLPKEAVSFKANKTKKSLARKAKETPSPEAMDASERVVWAKEKREYWVSRFRKVLAAVPEKSKPKNKLPVN